MSRDADFDYEDWRTALADLELTGLECPDCGYVTATPKRGCVRCGSRDLWIVDLATSGTVHSVTTIAVPPEGFDDDVYQVAVVDLGPARITARIESEDPVEIDDAVELVDVITDDDRPAPVFGPIES